MEYYVSNMPSDMVLLSAHDYASDGAAILMKDSGVVLGRFLWPSGFFWAFQADFFQQK
jgi:hypothetical protein